MEENHLYLYKSENYLLNQFSIKLVSRHEGFYLGTFYD